ncbi:MAG: methionyl-tRNA formyltransferase [Candidatus Omnitrophota bacterium]
MRIVFFGTGRFGIPLIEKLIESRHEIAAVVTQPDKKRDRGWSVHPTAIKAFVTEKAPEITILQPEKKYDKSYIDSLKSFEADVFVAVDYGQILKKEVLDIPTKYCINLHPSLLPKYRGAAPVNRALLNGETETGNTVFRITEKMDAGSIILQERDVINESDNALDLLARLSVKGAFLILKALDIIDIGEETFIEQNEAEASYAPKLLKTEGEIDWGKNAEIINNQIRGMEPWPGAFTRLRGKILKIIRAEKVHASSPCGAPGTVRDEKDFIVNTGEGCIKINIVQLEGKKIMRSPEFLAGQRIEKGLALG